MIGKTYQEHKTYEGAAFEERSDKWQRQASFKEFKALNAHHV
jgi:hypothetical protein